MERNKLNLIIDVVALVFFTIVLFSGFSMGAFHGAPGSLLWGMGKRAWLEIHEMASYLLLTALLVHLLLHANWLRVMFCGNQGAGLMRQRAGKILMACACLLLAASVLVPKWLGTGADQNRSERMETGPKS